jgi:monovalent cation:H+ antiporter-2, CPA2 family
LLGIFFFTVGMSIDARVLAQSPFLIVGSVIGLIALKAALLVPIGRAFKLSWPVTVETALLLGPAGEFAFVGIGLAASLGVVSADVTAFTLAIAALTMALIPMLAVAARRLAPHLAPPKAKNPALAALPPVQQRHAIVVGYGRVGQVVCGMLDRHGVPFTAADYHERTVTEHWTTTAKVYFGDASDPAFLKACGLMEASGIIVTIHDQHVIDKIVVAVRSARPDILIVSRARDADHARHLYEVGVTDAVPETIEASLQLSEAALVGLGIATGPVIASIHEERDRFRHQLQQAASAAGLGATYALRAKTKP